MKKNIVNNQERFDGFAVTLYDGKFSGAFDIEEGMGQELAMDDIVTFVVTGRVAKVGFDETKTGDIKRTNVFQVTSSTALDSTLATNVLTAVTSASPQPGQMPGQRTIDNAIDDLDAPEDLDEDDRALLASLNGAPKPAVKITDPELVKYLQEQ